MKVVPAITKVTIFTQHYLSFFVPASAAAAGLSAVAVAIGLRSIGAAVFLPLSSSSVIWNHNQTSQTKVSSRAFLLVLGIVL